MVRLFDILNGKVIATEHCFTLYFLKNIMDAYPEDHLKIFTYLFYMTCPNPDLNPFFHFREDEKEEVILEEVGAEFSTEDDLIQHGLTLCKKIYETESSRAYYGIKKYLDNVADTFSTEKPSFGRDGSSAALLAMAKGFDDIRQSFKGAFKDLQEEQSTTVRGGQKLAYDG